MVPLCHRDTLAFLPVREVARCPLQLSRDSPNRYHVASQLYWGSSRVQAPPAFSLAPDGQARNLDAKTRSSCHGAAYCEMGARYSDRAP